MENKNYRNNEQLASLLTAKKYLNDNLIITFSDIIYDYNILSKIIKDTKGDIVLRSRSFVEEKIQVQI